MASRLALDCLCLALSGWWPAHVSAMQASVAQRAQAAPRGAATPPSGTAIIRGRVLDRDTQRPLRRAFVEAYAPGVSGGFDFKTATTDEQGRYELKELPAGLYRLSARKPAYVGLAYGQERPTDPSKPIDVLDAQIVERVDFALMRGAAIMGRVVDEYGDPLPDVLVGAVRPEVSMGVRRMNQVGVASTDDLGEYRMFGVPPGQYYISATFRNPPALSAEEDDRTGYAVTYFPAAPNTAGAQRLTVAAAQIVSEVNITLVPARAARISGTGVDARGRPVSEGFVSISPRDDPFNGGGGAQMRPDGTFTLSGITPGDYILRLQLFRTPNEPEVATAEVAVNGADITDVRLAVPAPSTASGRVVVDPAAAGTSLQPQDLHVFVQPKDPKDPAAMFYSRMVGPGTVNDDLTFEVKAPPGRHTIGVYGLPSAWSQKSVRVNGVDVTDTGIDLKASETVSGMEIEVTNITTTLSGVVTDSRGQLSRDYILLVFPQDRERWPTYRFNRGTRPDQDGRYKMTALRPGEYYAVALEPAEGSESNDPELLERIVTRATPFSLSEGETRALDLKLTSRP